VLLADAAAEVDGQLVLGPLDVPRVPVAEPVVGLLDLAPVADGLAERNWRFPLDLPCVTPVPGGAWKVSLQLAETTGYTEEESDLDADRLAAPLELRNWRPGDQYLRRGASHPEKIKTLFQEWRIPLWERRNWPVVTMSDEIVWAKLFGPDARFAATTSSRRIVRISVLAA
jgi:tRNA(Ile)-lysidine synthase